eukprot:scaffold6781_cov22-Tisochrysis_lutea.AAC.1
MHHIFLQASSRQQQEQEKLIKEYELRQKAKSVVVPTDDGRVRQMLRQLGEPITLFGEKEVRLCRCTDRWGTCACDDWLQQSKASGNNLQQVAMERRERLRRTLAQQEAVTAELPAVGQVVVQEMAPAQRIYTELTPRGRVGTGVCASKLVCAVKWKLEKPSLRIRGPGCGVAGILYTMTANLAKPPGVRCRQDVGQSAKQDVTRVQRWPACV